MKRWAWGLVAGLLTVIGVQLLFSSRELPFREEFQRNLQQREEVVALARAGKLGPADPGEDQHWKKLPFRYRHLSDEGEVYVIQPSGNMTVRFYTFRGLLGKGYRAFYYVADGPVEGEQCEELAPHWFWVTSRS